MSGMADCTLGGLLKANADEYQAIINDLVAALKEARLWVQVANDQVKPFAIVAEPSRLMLETIDAALAKAKAQS